MRAFLTCPARRALLVVASFVLSAPAPVAPQTCVGPVDGAIGWWQGEGNGDNRVGPVPLTLTGGAGWTTGVVGQGFQFASGGFASVPDSSFRRPRNVTIEGWFNFGSVFNEWHTLVAKTLGAGTWESYGLFWRPNYLAGIICDAAGYGPTLQYAFTPTLGRWYHVAYTFDDSANVHRMYLDGTVRATGTNNKSIAYDAHPVMLGGEYENQQLTYWFIGAMDEVSVYGRALRAEEIQAIYAAGAGGKCMVLDVAPAEPAAVRLAPVSPTPARGAARVRFELVRAASVHLDVHDLQGRLVQRLAVGEGYAAGPHEVSLATAGWAPGVYVLRLAAAGEVRSQRLVVLN